MMTSFQPDDDWNLVSDIEEPMPRRCGLHITHFWDRQFNKRVSIRDLPEPVRKALNNALPMVDTDDHSLLQFFYNPERVEVRQGITPFSTQSLKDDYSFTIEYKPSTGLNVERRCLNAKLPPDYVRKEKQRYAANPD